MWYFTSPVSHSADGRDGPPLEFLEQLAIGLPHHVRHHVEPPAVRHPEHDLTRAGVGAACDRFVEHRHERVDAFDREALHAHVRASEESLQTVDRREALEQRFLLVGRERR